MTDNRIVLDANILIRAVLGKQVKELLLIYQRKVGFFTPDVCMNDAQKYLPLLFEKRGLSPEPALDVLSKLECLLNVVSDDVYIAYEKDAKRRITKRDAADWPILATAMAFNCSIWTEDKDFFGTGIPVWTTDKVPIFLESFY